MHRHSDGSAALPPKASPAHRSFNFRGDGRGLCYSESHESRAPFVSADSRKRMRVGRFFFLIGLSSSLRAGSINAASYVWSITNVSGVSGNLSFKGHAKTLTFVSCP